MDITSEIRRNHSDLSVYNQKFLEYVEGDAECLKRAHFEALNHELVSYPLQSWPLFLDPKTVTEIEKTSVGIYKLVKQIPERIFGNDSAKVGAYYGFDRTTTSFMLDMLKDPIYNEGILSRGDYVRTASGFKTLEANICSSLGGWESGIFSTIYDEVPLLRRFRNQNDLHCTVRGTDRLVISHLIECARKKQLFTDELNLGFAIPEDFIEDTPIWQRVDQVYAELLHAKEIRRGEVFYSPYEGFDARGANLYFDGKRVHVLIELYIGDTDQRILSCFMKGGINLHNGPVTFILSDKSNLALLSEHQDSSVFTREERRLIAGSVPWTRRMETGYTSFQGRQVDLPSFVRDHRHDMVLKPAQGGQGEGVYIGEALDDRRWEAVVEEALAGAGGDVWIVQEMVRSLPFMCQHGNEGAVAHDVVWGFFAFGDTYGGGFTRMMPTGKSGVINSSQGATEGLFWEVEEVGGTLMPFKAARRRRRRHAA